MSEEIHCITNKGKTAKNEFLPALYMVCKKLGHFFPPYFTHQLFKACVRYFFQIFVFSTYDSSSKTMKNLFSLI